MSTPDRPAGERPRGAVDFPVAPEVAYDYLVDPVNRPAWQSSLRGVELIDPLPVHTGMRWRDVTWPGLRPEMVLSEAIRPQRWVEQGSWHGVRAELTLSFAPQAGGCRVGVDFRLWGAGVLRPIGPVLTKISRPAVLADLRRAARILEVGGQPEAR